MASGISLQRDDTVRLSTFRRNHDENAEQLVLRFVILLCKN